MLVLSVLAACATPETRIQVPVSNDTAETIRLAEEGDPIAQTVMGNLYETRTFGTPDYGAAAVWYGRAAQQGDALARYFLGNLYERGLGVSQDYGRAAELYVASANGGNPSAAFKLGYFHENGLGVVQDFGAARRWYDVAEMGWAGQRVRPLQPEYLVVAATPETSTPQAVTLVPVASLAALPVYPETVVAEADPSSTQPPPPPEPGFYLHLASQREPDAALAAWGRAGAQFPDLLDGLRPVLAKLDLGAAAGTYYQVLAGPVAKEEDADIICALLQPQGQYCDPVPLLN